MEKITLSKRAKNSRIQTSNNQSTEKRVGFYIRVSTEEQAENPEGSIKNQEERLKGALGFKNAVEPFGKLFGVFCDAGRSGKDMNRPELKRLIKAIELGEVNMIMVSELSRLSRSIKDFSELWEFMQAHGCGFLSLRENFDTSSAAGEMMLYSIANFAQFERRQTSERVSANFLARAQRGLWNGGVLPIGYEPDLEKRGSLKINEDEAKVVRAAFQALIDQGSVSVTLKWLNQNGHSYQAPLRGGGWRPRRSHFDYGALHRLLSNKRYVGIREFKTKDGVQEIKAVWPPIIDPDTFQRAQKILAAGKKQKTGRESRYPYLLSTRINCQQCGYALIGVSAWGSTTKVPYYGHGNQQKREQALQTKLHRCSPYRIPARKLEERAWHEVVELIQNPAHRATLFQRVQELRERNYGKTTMEKMETEQKLLTEKIRNLTLRITELPKEVPADSFYDEMRLLADKRTKIDFEIRLARERGSTEKIANIAQFERLFEKLKTGLIDPTAESRRRVAHALIAKVETTESGFDLYYFAGADQIKEGEASASSSKSLGKKNHGLSSFKHLNGGPTRT